MESVLREQANAVLLSKLNASARKLRCFVQCAFSILFTIYLCLFVVFQMSAIAFQPGQRDWMWHKTLSLLNSYTPKEVRQSCLGEHLMCRWHLINSLNCVHSYEHWNILSLSHDGVDKKAMILFLWQRYWTPCWSCTRTTSQKRLFLSSMAPISTGTKRLLQVGVLTPKRRRLFRLSWFTLSSDCEPLRCC